MKKHDEQDDERTQAKREWALRCAFDERDVAFINHLYPVEPLPEMQPLPDQRVIHLTVAEASLLKGAAQVGIDCMTGTLTGGRGRPVRSAKQFPAITTAVDEVRRQFETLMLDRAKSR